MTNLVSVSYPPVSVGGLGLPRHLNLYYYMMVLTTYILPYVPTLLNKISLDIVSNSAPLLCGHHHVIVQIEIDTGQIEATRRLLLPIRSRWWWRGQQQPRTVVGIPPHLRSSHETIHHTPERPEDNR